MRKPVGLCVLVAFLLGAVASAQTYYYNPDGGRYLHADPHCASIDEQYGESMAEISLEQAQNMGLIEYCADCMGGEVAPAGLTGESTAGSLRFGGSGRDQIDYLTLTQDGRIVMAGQTSSSDGTLSDRSKTGLTGWAALVDLQGNTIWNFCSRYGSDDRMRLPVVHEDGTITVLLQSNGNAHSQVELIRLDMEGNIISRKTLV